MSDHICKRLGIQETNPERAAIKCTICGSCERQDELEQRAGKRFEVRDDND